MTQQRFRRFHQRSGGVNDVVNHQRRTPRDVADQVHHFAYVHVDTPLIHDCQRRVNFLREESRALHSARIRGNHRDRTQVHLLKIFHQHRRSE